MGDRALVLVVDDDQPILELVAFALEGAGYRVLTAPNGAVALDLLRRSSEDLPDVVVTDVGMPLMDGYELIAACRREVSPSTPIVVMSADHSSRDRCLALGAAGWLPKPFTMRALLAAVGALLLAEKDS